MQVKRTFKADNAVDRDYKICESKLERIWKKEMTYDQQDADTDVKRDRSFYNYFYYTTKITI